MSTHLTDAPAPSVSFFHDASDPRAPSERGAERPSPSEPPSYWEEGRGWLITRYEDAVAVFRETQRFTPHPSAWEFAAPERPTPRRSGTEELDKAGLFALSLADPVRVRKLIAPAFTPQSIEWMRPAIQALIDELLDGVAGRDRIDLMADVACRIPPRVMGLLLRISPERQQLLRRFTEAARGMLLNQGQREDEPTLRQDLRDGIALLGEVIEERRRAPLPDDLLSTLLRAEEQGERLGAAELMALVALLVVGGFETTTHLIGFTVRNLLKRPKLIAQLRAQPELLTGLVEEVARHDNLVKLGVARYALEDVELRGVTIKKGQRVLVMLISALRDEATLTQAELIHMRRNHGASIAFGHGLHPSIGASLARLELRLFVGTLIRRYPRLRLVSTPTFGGLPLPRDRVSLEVQLHEP